MRTFMAMGLAVLGAWIAATPARACQVGPFRVYYDAEGQPLPEAQTVLNEAARYWIGLPDDRRRVVIRGHTDSLGIAGDNLVISAERARWVEVQLMARGVAAGAIALEAVGESRPEAPAGDGAAEQLNRRVEIYMDTAFACPAPPPAPKAQ